MLVLSRLEQPRLIVSVLVEPNLEHTLAPAAQHPRIARAPALIVLVTTPLTIVPVDVRVLVTVNVHTTAKHTTMV